MRLFDLHCDTIVPLCDRKEDFYCRDTQFSLADLDKFQCLCQTMAVFVPDTCPKGGGKAYADRYLDYLEELAVLQGDIAGMAESAADIEALTKKGKCALIRSIESGRALDGDLENVSHFAGRGVKIMTLVWNGENELGSGNSANGGLTSFGRQVIRKMEEVHMIIDASHLNDPGFDDLCSATDGPFIATHSNLRSVCPHKRNLKDWQFQEIVRRGGLVGVNLYRHFLGEDGSGCLDQVYRHVSHMLELGGEDVIACGSDFDGAEISPDLNSPFKLGAAAAYLLSHGISQAVIDKMYFDNAMAFLKRTEA